MLPTRNIASTNPNTMIFLIVKLTTQPFQKRLYSLTLQHSAFLKKARTKVKEQTPERFANFLPLLLFDRKQS
jgi:hypothetical protein